MDDDSSNRPDDRRPGDLPGRNVAMGVLVIDDEPMVRDVFRGFVEMAGRKSAHAGRIHGLESPAVADALPLMRSGVPGLVLLDFHLEDGTAADLLRELRRDPGEFRGKIVIVSGSSDRQAWEECQALGADDFARKPLSYRRFVELLDDSIGPEVGRG
jgi:twitching motility two-component system response regulator PilH